MINGIYTSALGGIGQTRKLDVVANNLANIDTPGFRRDELTFAERLTEALEDRFDYGHYNALVDRYGGAPYIDGIQYDPQQGAFDPTGRPFDFAIDGPGYFGVREAGSEEIVYTRSGAFTLDSTGRLVTADGRFQVLTPDGAPITLDVTGNPEVRADEFGAIFVGGEEVARLGVFEFGADAVLVKQGATVYKRLGGEAQVAAQPRVKQGSLESSTVNPVSEMVEMIKATRSAESNMLMIRFQDATLEKAINDLGRVPA